MPRTIRFHLDENSDPRIAAGVRLHGPDISTTSGAKLFHASDQDHLAFAISENRVIVTQDTDFLRIAASVSELPGIVFYPNQARSIGQVVRSILLIWEIDEPEEIRNRVEYI